MDVEKVGSAVAVGAVITIIAAVLVFFGLFCWGFVELILWVTSK